MFTVKTKTYTLTSEAKPVSVVAAQDTVYITLADKSELHIRAKTTPMLSAQLNMIQTAKLPNITVDFTNPKQLVSFV